MPLGKSKTYTAQIGGVQLSAEFSPCSWMYPTDGLQLRVWLDNKSWGQVLRKDLRFADATEQDVADMLASVKIIPCKTCGDHALAPDSVRTNRAGECDSCFVKALIVSNAERRKEAEAAISSKDAEYKAKGCTHRVDAWVHPEDADDYPISMWAVNPTAKDIGMELRKAGSTVLDDYTVTPL